MDRHGKRRPSTGGQLARRIEACGKDGRDSDGKVEEAARTAGVPACEVMGDDAIVEHLEKHGIHAPNVKERQRFGEWVRDDIEKEEALGKLTDKRREVILAAAVNQTKGDRKEAARKESRAAAKDRKGDR